MEASGRSSTGQKRSADLILAMDTAGREGSVAIGVRRALPSPDGSFGRDGGHGVGTSAGHDGSGGSTDRQTVGEARRVGPVEVLARKRLGADEEHAALLIPRIREMMEQTGLGLEALDGIVVGAGPGSFTGVRVGAATAKGMARALDLPLWAFSSLAGAAAGAEAAADADPNVGIAERAASPPGSEQKGTRLDGESRPRCVLFDARGERIYVAAYRFSPESMDTLLAPKALTISELLEGLVPEGALLMGEGAHRHRTLLEEAGFPVLPLPAGVPTAEGLLHVLRVRPGAAPLEDPGRWEPDYLRASGAERLWKARKAWIP